MKSTKKHNHEHCKYVRDLEAALTALLANQEFDSGGHLVKRVPPTHSAVIKAKMLLAKEDKQ